MELSLPLASTLYGTSKATLCRLRQDGVNLAEPLDVADALLNRSTRHHGAVRRIVQGIDAMNAALELLGVRQPAPPRQSVIIQAFADAMRPNPTFEERTECFNKLQKELA